jgi:glutamate 5-kinase
VKQNALGKLVLCSKHFNIAFHIKRNAKSQRIHYKKEEFMSEIYKGNPSPSRQNLSAHRRIVVKVGTTQLTYPNGHISLRRIERLCAVLSDLRSQEKEIILVTSGAIAVGAERLNLPERPRDTIGKQVASAVGQAMLTQMYQQFFTQYNQQIAQILLTKDVISHDVTQQNARTTLFALLQRNVIPLVNENDSISTDELGFSENDTLSAYVAIITDADALIMLSDIDGLFSADPKTDASARFISEVTEITPEVEALAGQSSTQLGTGGMVTKIEAARLAAERGIDTVIASGADAAILWRILDGEPEGTLFVGKR